MKILLDVMRWCHQRLTIVIMSGTLNDQQRCRLIEVRDRLGYGVAQVLGKDEAQAFLEHESDCRIDPAHEAARKAQLKPDWIVCHDARQGEMAYAMECLHCGQVQKFATPIELNVYAAAAKAFVAGHRACQEGT